MPLHFDPAALMAPGGIVHGLDDLGSAVMNAMNSRAARKYQAERDAKHRGEQVSDRELGYTRALEGEKRSRNFDWWAKAADAGPEERPNYSPDLSPAEIEQLEGRRLGKIADRAARALGTGGNTIVPPPKSVGVKEPATDEYGDPIPGKHVTIDQPLDLPTRVGMAEDTAADVGKMKGRGAQAAEMLEYAQGGREAADTIQNFAVPWMPDDTGVNAFGRRAVAAFNAGGTLEPGARDAAIAEEASSFAPEAAQKTVSAAEAKAKALELRALGKAQHPQHAAAFDAASDEEVLASAGYIVQ